MYPENKRVFDLEERTTVFAERVREFCMKVPRNVVNNEYVPQLLRSGSSPGANYMETEKLNLGQEAKELALIFNAILKKRGIC